MIDSLLLDLSHYDFQHTLSGVSTWNAKCLYASGVRRVIIGCYSRQISRQMIIDCINAGIEVVGLYGFIYFGADNYYVHRDTDNAIVLAKDFNIKMIWIDCETDAKDIGVNVPESWPSQRVQQIKSVVAKVNNSNLTPGIYTGGWWWPSGTNNSTEFAHLPLWNANYLTGVPMFVAGFGGWNECIIRQYTSTKVICNRGRDHNYFETDNEIEDDDMTPEQLADIEELFRRTGGRTDRAYNGDLMLYCDGLNDALTEHLLELDEEVKLTIADTLRDMADLIDPPVLT